jgi:hypothetical protein
VRLFERFSWIKTTKVSTSLFGRGRGVPANDCLDSKQRLIVDDYCNDESLMEEAIGRLFNIFNYYVCT